LTLARACPRRSLRRCCASAVRLSGDMSEHREFLDSWCREAARSGTISMAEVRANQAVRDALRYEHEAAGVPAHKDECLHGAPSPTQAIVDACMGVCNAADLASSTIEGELLAVKAHLRAHPRLDVDTVRKVLLCMATDAVLARNWPAGREFTRRSILLQSFLDTGDVRITPELLDVQRSDWHVRRHCAVNAPCKCFGARHAAECALPGCGARHEVAGVKLLGCVKCRQTFYCGAAHQHEHWRRHKLVCKAKKATASADAASGEAAGATEG
jgi:hypothetical protein